ncbi:MAG: nitrous oxide reductase family maturation protein NosD [Candidatus Hodarchaeota archaeon]
MKSIFIFLMLFLIIISISTQINMKNCIETAQEDLKFRTFDLKQAGFWNNFTFIHVTDLNWTIANESDWCSGSGTWGDPYLIENMIINASDSPTGCGIWIENSVNVYFKIRNVTVFETTNGIKLENTNKGSLENNVLSNNIESGIYMINCINNTISKNQLINNGMYGIYLSSNCSNNKIVGNAVKDNGASFGDAGIYLTILCNDNEIRENNIYDNYVYGINLENSCEGNLIYNNTLKNIVSNQQDYGIRLYSACHQNNVSRNLFENLDNYAIYLVTSDGTSISNNQIIDISTGMWILLADQSDITSNSISGGSLGISISGCYENNINGNFINNTTNYAIRIYTNCDDNEFYDNIIKDNNGIGVELVEPLNDNNIFYRNSFISNAVNVFDNGTANFWNNSMIGNYWDNYTGVDLNNDHIGDSPYSIPGGANSNDSLPIVDHAPPTITIYTPTSSEYGTNAPEFNIFVNETYVYSMWYTINNSGTKYYFTENGTIDQCAWNVLSDGNVVIAFHARDIAWKTGSNSVFLVKDTSQTPDGPQNPDNGSPSLEIIVIIVISVIVILVIAIAGIVTRGALNKGKIKKSRKLNEEQLSEAHYFKDITSIITILAIHNESGLCLSKIALHGGIGLDENLFTGFISAIGNFKNELANQMGLQVRGVGGDNIIQYNEFTITLMDGEYLRLGLVSYNSLGDSIKEQCGQVLRAYENKHVNDLKNFDGELKTFDDFKETIEKGLEMNLNRKCIINVKELNNYDAHESFITILNDLNSRSDGFYPAEIAFTLVQEMNISDQEANLMVYEAYKNQIFLPIY